MNPSYMRHTVLVRQAADLMRRARAAGDRPGAMLICDPFVMTACQQAATCGQALDALFERSRNRREIANDADSMRSRRQAYRYLHYLQTHNEQQPATAACSRSTAQCRR